ncbi:MAG: ABC transporter permease [Lautropia sp.]|nr:ABC transporter permease [Lautropia sp.]
MKKFLAAVDKEFRLFRRDWHGLFSLFVMPTAFMLIMSVALDRSPGAKHNAPIMVAGLDSNPVNQALGISLQQLQFDVIHRAVPARRIDGLRARLAIDSEEWNDDTPLETLKNQLRTGAARLIIYNPNPPDTPPASEQVLRLLIMPDTDPRWLERIRSTLLHEYMHLRIRQLSAMSSTGPGFDASSTLSPEVQAILKTQMQHTLGELGQYLRRLRIDEVHVDVGGRTARPSSAQHSVPAWLIFGMFFIMVPLANVMTMERRTNTLTRLRLTQAPASLLLLSRLAPYFLINQIQFVGMVLLGKWLLPLMNVDGFELAGPLWPYALLSCAISLAALGYGLMIGVKARTAGHAAVLGGGVIILLSALGGIMVPIHIMPPAMQTLALISPMSWALRAFHALQLHPGSLQHVYHYIALLVVFGGVCMTLASFKYQKQLRALARF